MLSTISKIGLSPGDNHELRIQKGFLNYLAVFMSVGGIVWGSICLYFDLYFQAIFPLSYFGISILNLLYFHISKNFAVVRFIQTFISLVLPFALQWSLGGFDASGSIMWWAILSVIASLSFQSVSTSVRWLFFYIALTIVSAVFEEQVSQAKPDILPSNSILFVSINLILISSIVFGLVVFFVRQFKNAENQLQVERDALSKTNKMLQKSHETLKAAFEKESKSKASLEEKLAHEGEKQLEIYEQILSEQKKILQRHEK